MSKPLEDILRRKLKEFPRDNLEPFYSQLKKDHSDRVLAIIAYGSCLSSVTKSDTSTPDFYLFVNRYRDFHKKFSHRLLNWILPPNIYHFPVNGQTAKYNVISRADVMRETSWKAPDLYNVGRLSKRIALAWSQNQEAEDFVVQSQADAMRRIAIRVMYMLPESFTLETFVKKALKISYVGDVRVEAQDKIERLYEAEKEHYEAAYAAILAELELHNWLEEIEGNPRNFRIKRGSLARFWGRFRCGIFLALSRLRAQARWPKGMVTVENWVDYLLAKIERTQGIKIELTPTKSGFGTSTGGSILYI